MGGVGEIGSNMTVLELQNEMVIIDYGILFPYDDFFDINYLIVDTTELQKTEKKITLFITHGHEDHIGAIYHFLMDFPQATVYAPNFARTLILKKLLKRKMQHEINLYDENTALDFENFQLHPIHVTHSIPDTFGLIFQNTDLGFSLLFISDFKIDMNPLYEEAFNTEKIKKLFSKTNKNLAMIDSTNILVPGHTPSESDLTPDLEDIISGNKRTFITMFSSNIYRLKNILSLAKKHGRTITTIGQSIRFYLESAEESGLINLEDYNIKDIDSISNYNDPKLLFIVTGSQGEFLGATKRIVNGDQKHVTLNENDCFVFSSKPIPGNEKKIYQLYNELALKNVELINFMSKKIHASGHPAQEDLKYLVSNINPTDYIPIHGETLFLRKHVEFINDNFPQINTHFLTNFQGILLKGDKLSFFEVSQCDPLLIHGNGITIERERISERRKLACNGLVSICVNSKTKSIKIETKGLPVSADEHKYTVTDLVDYTIFHEYKKRDHDFVTEQARIKIRKFYKELLGYKPITLVSMV